MLASTCQPTATMSYCLNPDCQHPENPENNNEDGDRLCQSCGASIVLAGKYLPIRAIGEGGFGRSFLARSLVRDSNDETGSETGGTFGGASGANLQHCVIKQFLPLAQGRAKAETAGKLFRQEATRLQVLGKHPRIPQFIDYIEQEGRQYLVQEWVAGADLASEVTRQGAFREEQIWQLLKEILPALQYVHQHQVIHRDIKPANIIRQSAAEAGEGGSRLYLVDFGAAKFASGKAWGKTGTVIGSAAYTAPEQLRGKAVYASDIYSLGVTCVYLLTQTPPFDLIDSMDGNWVWRDYLKTPVSEKLGKILDKAIAHPLNQRFHSAGQVLKAMGEAAEPLVRSKPAASSLQKSSDAAIAPTSERPVSESHTAISRNQRAEVQEILQEILAPYPVRLQVTLGKSQLTIVLNRPEDRRVNYSQLAYPVEVKLRELYLPGLRWVKIYGRIAGQRKPEWSKALPVRDLPAKKLQGSERSPLANPSYWQSLLERLRSQEFWIQKTQERTFWLNSLLALTTLFVFGRKLVIFHPSFAWVLAAGFLFVKHLSLRNKEFATDELCVEMLAFAVLVGWLREPFVITDWFSGSVLSFTFLAVPLLHLKKHAGGR